MESQVIPFSLVTIFSLFGLYFGIFQVTKQKFIKTDIFSVLRDITPLPDILNYWLIKIFIIVASFFFIYIGLYGIINNL